MSQTPPTPNGFSDLILKSHNNFLAFVQSRVGNKEAAEDILQTAYLKGIQKNVELKDKERVVAWFYRILRNSIIDYYRKKALENRISEKDSSKAELFPEKMDSTIEKSVCKCMEGIISTMKPEYAEAIRLMELDEQTLSEFAHNKGLNANNAAVRLHRARQRLKERLLETCGTCAQHACLDCCCKQV